jgi:hypothetical protein
MKKKRKMKQVIVEQIAVPPLGEFMELSGEPHGMEAIRVTIQSDDEGPWKCRCSQTYANELLGKVDALDFKFLRDELSASWGWLFILKISN